jgi:hypothetical protein
LFQGAPKLTDKRDEVLIQYFGKKLSTAYFGKKLSATVESLSAKVDDRFC